MFYSSLLELMTLHLGVSKLGRVKYVLCDKIFVGDVLQYGFVLHNGLLVTQDFFARYLRTQKFPDPKKQLQTIAVSRGYREIMIMFACLTVVPKELMDQLRFMEIVEEFILSLERDWADDKGLSPFQQFDAIKQAASTLVQDHVTVIQSVKRERCIEDTPAAIVQNAAAVNTSAKRVRIVIGGKEAIQSTTADAVKNPTKRERVIEPTKEAKRPASGLI
jgi:hypothetical protein